MTSSVISQDAQTPKRQLVLSQRDRSIVKAVVTSLASKGGGLLVQVVAMPYAIRCLGVEVYGMYAAALAVFAWASVCEIGLGASMTRGIVAALAQNDRSRAASLFFTGLGLVGLTLAGGMGVVLIALHSFGSVPSERFPLLMTICTLSFVQILMICVARARSGYQETHITNIFGAVGNTASLFLMMTCIRAGDGAVILVLTLNGPPVVAQMANGIAMVLTKSEFRGVIRLNIGQNWIILREGAWLALGQLGVFLERDAPKLVLAASTSAVATGVYAFAVQIMLFATSLVTMITIPLVPAITDAMFASESEWWTRRVARIISGIAVAGTLLTSVGGIYGPALIRLVTGNEVALSAQDCIGLGVWTTMLLCSNVLYAVLVAAGRMRQVALHQFAQGVVVLLLFFYASNTMSFGLRFAAAAAITSAVTLAPWAAISRGIASNGR